MKKIIFSFLLLISSFSYGAEWKITPSEKRLHIMYKILSPLMVEVEKTVPIILPNQIGNYTYSKYNKSKRPIEVKVKAEYNIGKSDQYLREIYKTVHFELADDGNFELRHNQKQEEKIVGKGYFVDNGANSPKILKPTKISKEFSNTLPGNSFNQKTWVDADFKIENENQPIGIYKGTLKLNVWFDHN